MSNSVALKKADSEEEIEFSIAKESEQDEIPGVTRLISVPSSTRTAIQSPHAAAAATPTNASTKINGAPSSLRDYGVVYELRFQQGGSHFNYHQMISHQPQPFPAWQKALIEKMILSLEGLNMKDTFQEYNAQKDVFVFDLFGADTKQFIQVVQLHVPSHRVYVLFSQQSLEAQKTNLLTLLRGSDEEASMSIELEIG